MMGASDRRTKGRSCWLLVVAAATLVCLASIVVFSSTLLRSAPAGRPLSARDTHDNVCLHVLHVDAVRLGGAWFEQLSPIVASSHFDVVTLRNVARAGETARELASAASAWGFGGGALHSAQGSEARATLAIMARQPVRFLASAGAGPSGGLLCSATSGLRLCVLSTSNARELSATTALGFGWDPDSRVNVSEAAALLERVRPLAAGASLLLVGAMNGTALLRSRPLWSWWRSGGSERLLRCDLARAFAAPQSALSAPPLFEERGAGREAGVGGEAAPVWGGGSGASANAELCAMAEASQLLSGGGVLRALGLASSTSAASLRTLGGEHAERAGAFAVNICREPRTYRAAPALPTPRDPPAAAPSSAGQSELPAAPRLAPGPSGSEPSAGQTSAPGRTPRQPLAMMRAPPPGSARSAGARAAPHSHADDTSAPEASPPERSRARAALPRRSVSAPPAGARAAPPPPDNDLSAAEASSLERAFAERLSSENAALPGRAARAGGSPPAARARCAPLGSLPGLANVARMLGDASNVRKCQALSAVLHELQAADGALTGGAPAGGAGARRLLRSCAVVGGSGVLAVHPHGRLIDAHEHVLRVNACPVSGHESRVGSRTSVRFVNTPLAMRWASSLLKRSAFPPELNGTRLAFLPLDKPQTLQLLAQKAAELRHDVTLRRWTSRFRAACVDPLWRGSDRSRHQQMNKVSRLEITFGFEALMHALYSCARVSTFGFYLARSDMERSTNGGAAGAMRYPYHYWENVTFDPNAKSPFRPWTYPFHNFVLEQEKMDDLHRACLLERYVTDLPGELPA